MFAILKGMHNVFGERRLRPYVWGPMLVAGIVFLAITVLAYIWLAPWAQDLIGRIPVLSSLSGLLGGLAFLIFWWLISSILYLAIAGILSSFLWERLSREVEIMEGTLPEPEAKVGCGGMVYDTIIRGGVSLVVAVFTLLLGWLFFGAVGVVMAGWLGLLDYTSCAFARRSVLIDRQFGAIYECKGWMSFLLGAGVISLFPFLNVLFLPVLVAGGTVLCGRSYPKPT
jgi:uncharacterized protein involved in cysteine biosynthesis